MRPLPLGGNALVPNAALLLEGVLRYAASSELPIWTELKRMPTHELARIPRITLGAGARRELGRLSLGLVPEGATVLLVADPGLASTGMTAEVEI